MCMYNTKSDKVTKAFEFLTETEIVDYKLHVPYMLNSVQVQIDQGNILAEYFTSKLCTHTFYIFAFLYYEFYFVYNGVCVDLFEGAFLLLFGAFKRNLESLI